MAFKSFDILRRAGFDNLNLDLMFAIPGQTMEVWRATLAEALTFGSEHLSTYEVIYEDDTPLFAQLQAGKFDVDEDLSCAMYEELVARATAAGFRQYEVANFARDRRAEKNEHPTFNIQHSTSNEEEQGDSSPAVQQSNNPTIQQSIPLLACKHNVNYWRGGSFYGLGPSATSYVRGVRTKNWPNTQLYCEQLEKGKRAIESREELPPLKRAGETAAFGLRMNAGWPFAEFRRVTDFDLRDGWSAEMNQLVERGWAAHDDQRFRLTPRGLRFADSAAELFLR
jgi:oxygen-independent coproporphyrinogen-3 oxidase